MSFSNLRQITLEEWGQYEWVLVSTIADEYPVYLRVLKKTPLPDPPDDGMLYKLEDVTKVGDTERKYKYTPVMTTEER